MLGSALSSHVLDDFAEAVQFCHYEWHQKLEEYNSNNDNKDNSNNNYINNNNTNTVSLLQLIKTRMDTMKIGLLMKQSF